MSAPAMGTVTMAALRVDWALMVRRTRLGSGLVLFTYVVTHLTNHAFGLISLDALELARQVFIGFWRFPPVSVVFYTAFGTHILLALWSIYRRRSLRMPPWEAAQLLLGLSIPPMLLQHYFGTRLAHDFLDINDSYTYVLLSYWVFNPQTGLLQVVVLLVAWLHGCIGLHFWLRLSPWYSRSVPYLYGAVLLMPVLALLGFGVAGRNVLILAQNERWLQRALAAIGQPSAEMQERLLALQDDIQIGFAAALACVLLARWVRQLVEVRRGGITLRYPDGRAVVIQPGMTVLEASRSAVIPHASVCGGRGRCSTCRVRVGAGAELLEPPLPEEQKVLDRVGAPPKVRLACQIRPSADLEVSPLLPPTATPREALRRPGYLAGREQEIAILFADLRAFTRLSEHRLPFDVVFLLNRYFAEMGHAVERAGGRVDKFIGDGVMALFGIESSPAAGAKEALAAARAMAENLQTLNSSLASELSEPLRIGIGIHAGAAIVGEMGYGRATSLTAIGDAVNSASRLESLSKEFKAQLIVSSAVEALAGVDLGRFPRHDIDIRGRAEKMTVRVVESALDLPR
ncbi:MAG: adenylate/guanylate cyclase domain-containing protein [Proteobacteria bacterium]|nr:adenylate/guanylate cyclase domain-containing protein [Pseudomonadota bacterium]MBI3498474.1 adenylate/guanylate cyclase domain-containing protein [Pseudomonadota bacterium]